jgi:hypothetical protein
MLTTPLGSARDPATPSPSDLPGPYRGSLAARRTLLRPADRHRCFAGRHPRRAVRRRRRGYRLRPGISFTNIQTLPRLHVTAVLREQWAEPKVEVALV